MSLTTKSFSSIQELGTDLLEDKVDAVMFNEAYRGLLDDSNKDFTEKTKIIYQYEIKEELKLELPEVDVANESFNVYISGIDTFGPVSTVSRSDANMIVTVNPETKQILMTSVPRDYYVELAPFGEKDKHDTCRNIWCGRVNGNIGKFIWYRD